MNIQDKFMPEPNTGCWIWIGWSDTQGYGRLKINGKIVRAHRYMFEKYIGEIPEGKIICHKCDNKSCVNPEHLYAVTLSDNLKDAHERGQRGKPRNHKIPESIIRNIRADKASGIHWKDISMRYSVSKSTVHKVCNRSTRYEVS